MKHAPRLHRIANLSESIRQQLNMYAFAAGAAGVGVLALAQSAGAKIVYTPTHVLLHGQLQYPLDLNNDGHADFSFNSVNGCTGGLCFASFTMGAASKNGIWAKKGPAFSYALALHPGANIGPHKKFVGDAMMLKVLSIEGSGTENGFWRNVKNRYVGLKFIINGGTHFGWARLSVHNQGNQITSILTGYAYETVPNKPIMAGKTKGPDVITMPLDTGTLGHLALGRK